MSRNQPTTTAGREQAREEREKGAATFKAECIRLYAEGDSVWTVAKKLGTGRRRVMNALHEVGTKMRTANVQKKLDFDRLWSTPESLKALADAEQRYHDGHTIRECAEWLGMSHDILRRTFKERGVKFRTHSESNRLGQGGGWSDQAKSAMKVQYESGRSVSDIAKEWGTGPHALTRLLESDMHCEMRGIREQMRINANRAYPESVESVIARRTIVDDDGCVLWQGSLSHGVPAHQDARYKVKLTHWVWRQTQSRAIPATAMVWRNCGKDRCINAECLRVTSRKAFVQTKARQGRLSSGLKHSILMSKYVASTRLKVTDEQVARIRERYEAGESVEAMAAEHGVAVGTVRQYVEMKARIPIHMRMLTGQTSRQIAKAALYKEAA